MEETRRTALSPMDNIMPRFYARLIFTFGCSAQQDPAKVCSFLQDGLTRASVDIPSIAGKVFQSSEDHVAKGALEVRINPNWVPKIHLQDLRDVIDYDDWVTEGLPQDELDPDRFFPAIDMPDLQKGAPVFIAQANFVAGGMLLAVGMFHSVIDGTSGMWLAKKWAEYTRQLQGIATDDHAALVISPQSADNQLLMNLWEAEGHEAVTLDDLTHGRKGAGDLSLWRLLGLDPVNPSPQPFSLDTLPDIHTPPPPVRSTIFYVSQKALAELKAAATADLSGENGISANDALMALLWRAIIRARFPNPETATLGEEEETTLDATFDGRANFSPDLPWTYLGSLIFISTARMTISELTSSDTPLVRIAREVRRASDAITTSRIHAAFGLAAALPDYNSLSFPFATFAGTEVCITSWIAWSLFDLDFGPMFRNSGRPDFLRPPRREFDPVCRRCVVLPLQRYGGCEILVSLVSDEISRLEADPEFSRFTSVMRDSLACGVGVLLLSTCLYQGYRWAQNLQAARRTGLPFTWSPIHELEIWAYFTNPILRWWCADGLLQERGWPRWARFLIKDWTYEDKGRAHKEYGEVFLVVSPAGMICYISDADTALAMCTRRKAFIKPPEKMKMLEPFGPSVVSTEGDLWRFHLRVTLPPFGESVHRTVWSETLRQSSLLTSAWVRSGSGSLKDDIYTLTVNVMSCVGFGCPTDWTDDSTALPQGHRLSLVRAIFGVVTNLPQILLLPTWLMKILSPLVYRAYTEFGRYMDELLAKEKAKMSSRAPSHLNSSEKGNLLTAVIAANNEQPSSADQHRVIKGPQGRTQLTDEEVKGNVFMFLLAGYDTTANTILFSSIVLAMYDDIQDEIIAEVRRITQEAEAAGRSELSYTEDLPKFRYLLAFMYEVMRVFPIVIPITRMAVQNEDLPVEGTKHTLPAGTLTIVNNTGVHYNDKYWPSPHVIEPRRWLTSSPNAYDPQAPTADQLHEIQQGKCPLPNHRRGTFMTFNEGPRACLGRRFAQIEFIAFFARLLRDHRLKLDDGIEPAEVERQIRLRAGGSPVTLVPPIDLRVRLCPNT
ncbi:hypothetical protein FE257_004521 [Aspergillus nanangensis]|uniref:Trichothecene 3-O-acetyltransferase-like N-terminal domain-containing protein n=1 Tax=Aspergillus nanangensis TaxID=2582783 RepID=A0AAD4GYG7_ASPNN|nr:hypothetical protein FE257_004521 [Aspergillus nanangensis]